MEFHNTQAADLLRIAEQRGKLDPGTFASSEDGRAIAHRKGATWIPVAYMDDRGMWHTLGGTWTADGTTTSSEQNWIPYTRTA